MTAEINCIGSMHRNNMFTLTLYVITFTCDKLPDKTGSLKMSLCCHRNSATIIGQPNIESAHHTSALELLHWGIMVTKKHLHIIKYNMWVYNFMHKIYQNTYKIRNATWMRSVHTDQFLNTPSKTYPAACWGGSACRGIFRFHRRSSRRTWSGGRGRI